MLTGNFIKPSCRMLKLLNKNLEKFTISGLSKISALSELRKFQKFSGPRKFLKFQIQGKNLENFITVNT